MYFSTKQKHRTLYQHAERQLVGVSLTIATATKDKGMQISTAHASSRSIFEPVLLLRRLVLINVRSFAADLFFFLCVILITFIDDGEERVELVEFQSHGQESLGV
jgi:hypothetical protein